MPWPPSDHQRAAYIRWLTANTVAFTSHVREHGELRMPLELKGLKANMMRLHKRIDTLNQLATAGDTKGGELEKALTDIGTQLASHMDDLNFAATMLGNSAGGSQEGEERPAGQTATTEPPAAPPAPAVTPSPPGVGQDATFQPGLATR